MKKNKNKLTNFLKTGILFFGISVLLWNCQTESGVIENNESSLLENFQNNFNYEDFKEALPYDYDVNWNNPLKQYSEELETSYYEFSIAYTSKFNPDEIYKSKTQKNKYNISYKILITANEKKEYTYYVVKFYKENSKNTSHLEKSFAGSSNFSGFIHLLNKSSDIVFAKKFEAGIEDSKKFYNQEFKDKRNKDENLYARVEETCTTVTTHQWTDNYVRWGNGPPILVSSTYNGSTQTESCESYWLPDLNIFGGSGAGLYIKNSIGGIYNDCQTASCRHQIRDLALGEGFNQNLIYFGEGIKPIYENDNKCLGIQEMWSMSQNSGDEFAAVLTTDGAILITQQLNPTGRGFGGIYEFNGTTYYQYPISDGPPSRTYSGQIESAGRYFIPISATIHSHTPCISDGTDGITNNTINDDQNFASHYQNANHYIIGCNSIGQFNNSSNQAFNIQNGNLNILCNNIN